MPPHEDGRPAANGTTYLPLHSETPQGEYDLGNAEGANDDALTQGAEVSRPQHADPITEPGYYPQVAPALLAAGYGPAPLPEGQKAPPPEDYTGATGKMATGPDVYAWAEDPQHAKANTAARLPKGLIGLDRDYWGDKPGRDTWEAICKESGDPPPTYVVSSRDDGSGIFLYKLPEGIDESQLTGGLPGIEVLRFGHRYVVAPGSVHPVGGVYRCWREDTGEVVDGLPPVTDLPTLPIEWVRPFTKATKAEARVARTHRAHTRDLPCQAVLEALTASQRDLTAGGSRHDALGESVGRLLRLGDHGHKGVARALRELRAMFVAVTRAPRVDGDTEYPARPMLLAIKEFSDYVQSGESMIDRSPTPESDRRCCKAVLLPEGTMEAIQGIISGQRRSTTSMDLDWEPEAPNGWLHINLHPGEFEARGGAAEGWVLHPGADLSPEASERGLVAYRRPMTIEEADKANLGKRRLTTTKASEIVPEHVEWVWEGRIARKAISLLAGREGKGKSTVATGLAAMVTRGALAGCHHGTPRPVFIVATEDDWAAVIVPRLMAADADLDLVYRVGVRTETGFDGELTLPDDIQALQNRATQVGAALLVLDPLISRLDGSLDTHKDAPVRKALEPLTKMLSDTGMACIGLIHLNKTSTTDPLNAVMASRAFSAVPRSVSIVIDDPDAVEGDRTRLFGTPKNNLGPDDLPLLRYRVVGHDVSAPHVSDPSRTLSTSRIEWLGEVSGSIQEAIESRDADGSGSATGRAANWVKEYLEGRGGFAPSAEVKVAAGEAGHGPSAVARAFKHLKLASERTSEVPSTTVWYLPAWGRCSRCGDWTLTMEDGGCASCADPTDEGTNAPDGSSRSASTALPFVQSPHSSEEVG